MTEEVEAQGDVQRAVGAALGIGILLLPFVFAWFTLRKGYGKTARSVSFVWMMLVLLMGVGASQRPTDTQPILESEGAGSASEAIAEDTSLDEGSITPDPALAPGTQITKSDAELISHYGTCSSILKAIIYSLNKQGLATSDPSVQGIIDTYSHQATIYWISLLDTVDKYPDSQRENAIKIANNYMNENIMNKSTSVAQLNTEKDKYCNFSNVAAASDNILNNQKDYYDEEREKIKNVGL